MPLVRKLTKFRSLNDQRCGHDSTLKCFVDGEPVDEPCGEGGS